MESTIKKIDCSLETVQDCILSFDKEEGLKELVLFDAFSNAPNTDLKSVLIRVTLLNSFYSTRLYNNRSSVKDNKKARMDLEAMARHIADNPNIDKWVKSNNEEERLKAFDYIAFGSSTYKTQYHSAEPSFASKYCSWCNPEGFPIMDSFSMGVLLAISDSEDNSFNYLDLNKNSIQNYRTFCNAHRSFRLFLQKLHDGRSYSTKAVDKYLWYYGTKNPSLALKN